MCKKATVLHYGLVKTRNAPNHIKIALASKILLFTSIDKAI